MININAPTRKALIEAFEAEAWSSELGLALLSEAQVEVFKLMSWDSYPRFLKSEVCSKLVRRLGRPSFFAPHAPLPPRPHGLRSKSSRTECCAARAPLGLPSWGASALVRALTHSWVFCCACSLRVFSARASQVVEFNRAIEKRMQLQDSELV